MSQFLTLFGLVLSIYGGILCAVSNLNLGVVLTFFIGLSILLWGMFYQKIKILFQKPVLKWIKIIGIVFLCFELALVMFIGIYGGIDSVSYNEDAIIVLGAGVRGDKVTLPLKMRLDKAVEYHKKNPDAIIVVTGGMGFQETVTEASAMEKYLLENGVDKDVIVKEEKAASTSENMRFSKEILDSRFDEEYKTVVITNHFHIYRGVSVAKQEGFTDLSHMHAGLQWYNLIPCYLRESLAVVKMWVFG